MTTVTDSSQTKGVPRPIAEPTREQVLRLVADGLVLPCEAAWLAGVTRQCVHKWVTSAQINADNARRKHLRKLWAQHDR